MAKNRKPSKKYRRRERREAQRAGVPLDVYQAWKASRSRRDVQAYARAGGGR